MADKIESAKKEAYDSFINENYSLILERISGGTLHGQPINLDNPKEIAVAFYYYAESTHSRYINNVGEVL